jgi:hypothetical protein
VADMHTGYGEIIHRSRGVNAVIGVSWNLFFAEEIFFDAYVRHGSLANRGMGIAGLDSKEPSL